MQDDNVQDLSIDDFAGWVGETCEVSAGDAQVAMTLVAAEALDGGARAAGAFRLELLGPPSPVLAQATVTVRRPEATFEIFIVPIANDAAGTRYEAVFY